MAWIYDGIEEWQVNAATESLMTLIAPEIEGTNADGFAVPTASSVSFGAAMNLVTGPASMVSGVQTPVVVEISVISGDGETWSPVGSFARCVEEKEGKRFRNACFARTDNYSGDAEGCPLLGDHEATVTKCVAEYEKLVSSSSALKVTRIQVSVQLGTPHRKHAVSTAATQTLPTSMEVEFAEMK